MKKSLLLICLLFSMTALFAQKPCINTTRVDEGTPSNGCNAPGVLGRITLNLGGVATTAPIITGITANNGSNNPAGVVFLTGVLTHGGTKASYCYTTTKLTNGANKYE